MKRHAVIPGWMSIVVVTAFSVIAARAVAGGAEKVSERGEIDTKYLWATETIFRTVDEWETEFAAVEKEMEALAKFRGTLSQGSDQLYKFLKARDEVEPRVSRIYVYASLTADQDTRDGKHQAMRSRARSLAIKYGQLMSWVQPELTAMQFEQIDSWMREKQELELYRHAFDDLFRQKQYVLSPREEELLAMAGEVRSTPRSAYTLFSNADTVFPKIVDAEGKTREIDEQAFYVYMRSPDRRVRKDVYDAIVGTFAKHRNTAAALLNGAVQNHILTVKARGYDSCLGASLHGSNIPVGVYNNLVNTINENLPLLHRYQTIRKRVLKLDDGVHAYDLFAPFIGDQKLEYKYEDAVKTIVTALKPLGNDYLTQMKKGFDSRWVDVYPNKGKRSGAYSSGTYLTQPYILMNFHDTYEDMSTLAHEMGHSMHSYLSRGTQPYVYSDYDIFCAEVASTCNEILLQNYVLERTPDPKKKLYLLGEFLESIRGTVFRQTMFSEFEQRIHEMAEAREPLTADSMGAAYRKIMKKYYGPDYTHDDLVDNYWIRIPHFYRNFYVYKYATSYCAASNIANQIMKGEPDTREAYMKFLKGGGSKYPVDMLKVAGVDMTTSEPIQDAMKLFEGLLDQTEGLLTKLGKID
ncbi:MAG: oligoendopeptidase F [Phycisphaerales bacterium]|nr:MAG: oligoendopeptidase F [Phycisphaerales bacterium]